MPVLLVCSLLTQILVRSEHRAPFTIQMLDRISSPTSQLVLPSHSWYCTTPSQLVPPREEENVTRHKLIVKLLSLQYCGKSSDPLMISIGGKSYHFIYCHFLCFSQKKIIFFCNPFNFLDTFFYSHCCIQVEQK